MEVTQRKQNTRFPEICDTLMFSRLYLHIPFCLRKCDYCAFVSSQGNQPAINAYVDDLLSEMLLARAEYGRGDGLDSVYLGGGTPSLLSPHQVAQLLERSRLLFGWNDNAEITMEVNPGTVTGESLAGFYGAGVNRLSLGIQSFDHHMLTRLGRIHTPEQAIDAISAARTAGFSNLGLDLIHSLPGQTLEMWRGDLMQAVDCEPEHISIYGLTIENDTPFARSYPDNSPLLPDEDAAATMFETADKLLTSAGYEHYEIANYARPGFRSRHNSGYWKRDGYLGLGTSAHSFLRNNEHGVRFSSVADPAEYAAAIRSGKLPHQDKDILSREDAMAEFMFLGLRLAEGVSFMEFQKYFGSSPLDIYAAAFDLLARAGLIIINQERAQLTRRGMLLSNQVFSRFLP